MTQRTVLPHPFDAIPFRVGVALEDGVTRNRLDARDLIRVHHGARTHADATLADRARALVPLMSATQAFTGPAAALLQGVPLPRSAERDGRLQVSSLRPQRAMRRPGVVGIQRPDGEVRFIGSPGAGRADRDPTAGGLPVLEPALVWIDLGRTLSIADLVAAGDRLVAGTLRIPPLCTLDELAGALDRRAGSPGAGRARAALSSVRVGAWSRPETLLRLLIGSVGLPEPELNVEIPLPDGTRPIADLCWPRYRLIVEYDGEWHDAMRDADAERHERLVDGGWMVVHVRRGELFGAPQAVVARLLRRLAERGYRHPASAIDLTRMPRFVA